MRIDIEVPESSVDSERARKREVGSGPDASLAFSETFGFKERRGFQVFQSRMGSRVIEIFQKLRKCGFAIFDGDLISVSITDDSAWSSS